MSRSTNQTQSSRARPARRQLSPTIGPWYLVRKLGEGAWTEVYQARPTASTHAETADYVVKVLKPEFQHDPGAIQLLQREAYISQQVQHPHLSSILSAHIDKAPRYLVMPHVDGISAAAALKQAIAFQVPQSLWIVRQTAEALFELHQHGWRHGDVKPANIIVSINGHAMLADLGLAQRLDNSLTSTDAMTGSLAYACPEAFNPNVAFSPGSDVYSLGITLYELLTGSLPFRDQDPTDLAAAHLTRKPPDPRSIVPNISGRISRLLRQMLAKDSLRRPSPDELIERLVGLEVDTFSERLSA